MTLNIYIILYINEVFLCSRHWRFQILPIRRLKRSTVPSNIY